MYGKLKMIWINSKKTFINLAKVNYIDIVFDEYSENKDQYNIVAYFSDKFNEDNAYKYLNENPLPMEKAIKKVKSLIGKTGSKIFVDGEK